MKSPCEFSEPKAQPKPLALFPARLPEEGIDRHGSTGRGQSRGCMRARPTTVCPGAHCPLVATLHPRSLCTPLLDVWSSSAAVLQGEMRAQQPRVGGPHLLQSRPSSAWEIETGDAVLSSSPHLSSSQLDSCRQPWAVILWLPVSADGMKPFWSGNM